MNTKDKSYWNLLYIDYSPESIENANMIINFHEKLHERLIKTSIEKKKKIEDDGKKPE